VDSGKPQSGGEMGLAHSRRPQKDDVLGPPHISATRELPELLLADGGLEGEVEVIQRAPEGERRQAKHHLLGSDVRGSDLLFQQAQQELAIALLLAGGLLSEDRQSSRGLRQMQPVGKKRDPLHLQVHEHTFS
jgi:hypothetical protein